MTDLTDFGTCSDCEALPENWSCAECVLSGEKPVPEEYDV